MNRLIFAALLALPAIGAGGWFLMQGREAAATAVIGPGFDAPIACQNAASCLVQNHFDLTLGRGVTDPSCGERSYEEHHGVDFRILDLPTMMAGVPVKAAADGKVLRARDGLYDGAWLKEGRAAIGDQDCGNGVVIDHGNGYEVYYCHLRRGSIAVEPGQDVKRGETIAQVGMSGRAEFPHVHFGVTRDGTRIDPFTSRAAGEGCGETNGSLWAGPIPAHWMAQSGPHLSKYGFTDRAVTLDLIERGLPEPTRGSDALVFFARAIWLREGDIQRVQIEGPDGFVPIGSEDDPLERDKTQMMQYVGRKAQDGPFPPGEYRGRYQIERNGQIVLDVSRSIVLN